MTTLFHLPNHTLITLTGNDRHKFLHGFCTNDIKALPLHSSTEAFITNIKARILGHVFISSFEYTLHLHTVPQQADTLIPHLDRYLITEDVQLTNTTPTTSTFYLHGQPTIFESLTPNTATTQAHSHITRVDWLGSEGYLITLPTESQQSFLDLIDSAHIPLSDLQIFHQHRIAAGFPWFGQDISTDNLPQEVDRNDQAISFKKGCYLGQEPIARIDALGHVNKLLRRITIAAPFTTLPELPVSLIDPAMQKVAGVITSMASSPQSPEQTVALAIIAARFCKPKTSLMFASSQLATIQ